MAHENSNGSNFTPASRYHWNYKTAAARETKGKTSLFISEVWPFGWRETWHWGPDRDLHQARQVSTGEKNVWCSDTCWRLNNAMKYKVPTFLLRPVLPTGAEISHWTSCELRRLTKKHEELQLHEPNIRCQRLKIVIQTPSSLAELKINMETIKP